jgi:K+-transporting ATPase ATPase C chain
MKTTIIPALRLFAVLTLLTGGLYPLVVTVLGQVLFAPQVRGSLVTDANNRLVGSALLAQQFDSTRYFQPRPSACGYGTVASGASNKGPTSAELQKTVNERRIAFRTANMLAATQAVPNDMVFASGSGLDPHISPEAARMQVRRVAIVRNFDTAKTAALGQLVERFIEQPQWDIFGEPRVNVLLLNKALDGL